MSYKDKFEVREQRLREGPIKTITKESLSVDFKLSIPDYMEQSAIGSLFRTARRTSG